MAEFMEIVKKRKKICESYTDCCKCPLYNFSCGLLGNGTDIITTKELEAFKKLEEGILNWEKPIDWNKVEVDTKVLVRHRERNDWHKRYFARYENGKIYCWGMGKTSFSAADDDDTTLWDFAKLADDD